MSIIEELEAQMSSDLGIRKFADEDKQSFICRLLYSAIATWILFTTQDRQISENYERTGVSKTYITRNVSKILEYLKKIYPYTDSYFNGYTDAECVSHIRELYECGGYLVPEAFDEYIVLSTTATASVGQGLFLNRNALHIVNESKKSCGLGLYSPEVQGIERSLTEMFYLPSLNAKAFTVEYIKQLKWNCASNLGSSTMFFNPVQSDKLSDCWVDSFPTQCQNTIYKTNDWDYGFAKIFSNKIKGIKISDFLISASNSGFLAIDKEVRRFMYGLKAIYTSNSVAYLYVKGDYCTLRLKSKLPSRENAILHFLGWPEKHFANEIEFIIPIEMKSIVNNLLNNLCIKIRESDYE